MREIYSYLLCCSICFLFGVVPAMAQSSPVTALPYFCSFEDDAENAGWVLNPGNSSIINNPKFLNKWTIGTAAKRQGYKGLYICQNNDATAAMYAEKACFTYAYREFRLPAGDYDLAFSWRCLGEFNADEITAYWMPVSVQTNGGMTASEPGAVRPYRLQLSTGVKGDSLRGSSAWKYANGTLRVTNANTAYKLVFLWRNNADRTYNPGGCIDNVQIAKKPLASDCNQIPKNLSVANSGGTLRITWDAVRGNTYDVLYWLEGAGTVDSVSGLTANSCSIPIADMNTGLYTVWVRSVCPDGTNSLYAEYSGIKVVGKTSQVASACPEISLTPTSFTQEGMKVVELACSESGDYLLKATAVGSGGSIAGYMVEEIPYAPPFPFNAGTPFKSPTGEWKDDEWSEIVQLPFSFCFFDGVYRQAQVGANGIITFDTSHEPRVGGGCKWDLKGEQDIPNPQFIYKNSIFGVYEDAHMKEVQNDGGIYFGVLGEYPCRTFTASWYNAPSYSCLWLKNTYQIVLYEGTNVIDVYVKQRLRCDSWNEGIGIIGLINSDGSDGVAAPGRNRSDQWEVEESAPEAWRFIPLTTPVYDITWYHGEGFDGPVIGKNDSIWLTHSGKAQDTVTVRMQFSACNGDYFDLADTAIVQFPVVDSLPVVEANICEGETYQDNYIKTDQIGYHEVVLKSHAGCDSLVYRLQLSELETIKDTIDTMICFGDTLHWGTFACSKTGTYTYKERYKQGCDSLVQTINLTVLPKINYTLTATDAYNGVNSGSIVLQMQDPAYYYTLNGVQNAPLTGLSAGTYEVVVYNQLGCASEARIVTITTECLEADLLLPLEMICADAPNFVVPFSKTAGNVSSYSLVFSDDAKKAGFKDLLQQQVGLQYGQSGNVDIMVGLPANVRPGYYAAVLTLHDLNCGDKQYPFDFSVFYPSSLIAQKWDDVLGVLKTMGYKYSAYQWLKNNFPVEGATGSYYYLGEDETFQPGDMYQVLLTRVGEKVAVPTCPFYPVTNSLLPSKPVVKQESTSFTVEAPEVQEAVVTVYNAMGLIVMKSAMQNGIVSFPKPAQSGIYLIEIQPQNGDPKLAFRVMITN